MLPCSRLSFDTDSIVYGDQNNNTQNHEGTVCSCDLTHTSGVSTSAKGSPRWEESSCANRSSDFACSDWTSLHVPAKTSLQLRTNGLPCQESNNHWWKTQRPKLGRTVKVRRGHQFRGQCQMFKGSHVTEQRLHPESNCCTLIMS